VCVKLMNINTHAAINGTKNMIVLSLYVFIICNISKGNRETTTTSLLFNECRCYSIYAINISIDLYSTCFGFVNNNIVLILHALMFTPSQHSFSDVNRNTRDKG
jgi:hypothetical protein